jgi:hypothetical protein
VVTFYAIFGLQGARLVVEAGMDYPGIISGLVFGQFLFLFEDRDFEGWMLGFYLESGRKAYYSAPDNDDIVNHMLSLEQI